MLKTQAIVQRIREAHEPSAIVLHGSRAAGCERQHSDWDLLVLLHREPDAKVGREWIEDEDVEWQALRVPVPENEFLHRCGVQLQFARVLWEDQAHAGTALLNQAKAFYAKGVTLSEPQRATYRQYLVHKANGMEDDLETPYLFLRHQHIFFERATNWWFEMRGQYRKPLYVGMPIIEATDPEYFRLLMALADSESNTRKLEAARQLITKLFGE